MTAVALRQARAELTLTREEVAPARMLYEAAEWSLESARRWEEDACEMASRYLRELPPSLWGWGCAEMQSDGRDQEAALHSLTQRLAFDAPLTEDVCVFLREASALTGSSLPEIFTRHLGHLGQIGVAGDSIEQRFRAFGDATGDVKAREALAEIAKAPAAMSHAAGTVLRVSAARMAEVTVAVAEVDVPSRVWTPGEVERARAEWSARVASLRERGLIGRWELGPNLDAVRRVGELLVVFGAGLDDVREAMLAAGGGDDA